MEPKDFARLLLRRKSTVIVATMIVLATVVLGSLRAAPVFVSRCEVLFKAIGFELSEKDAQAIDPFGSIGTNLDFVTSPKVIERAAATLNAQRALGQTWGYGDVDGKVNVSLKPDTEIILLQVADSPPAHLRDKPEGAARAGIICNAVGEAYIEHRRDQGREAYRAELNRIRNAQISTERALDVARAEFRAAEASNDSARTVEKLNNMNTLIQALGDLVGRYNAIDAKLRNGLEDEGGEMYRQAGMGVPTAADLQRTATLGLIVGLMFGIGIALIREYMDDTVKDKESASRELGLPVLANLPATSDLDGFEGPPQATIEAARTLRATLASYGFPTEKRMLLVASSLSKRRSTTLAALAGAVAESGRSVLVIGSDLRSSRTHEAFGIANTIGLANVVRGQVPLRNAIRPAPGLENVFVLPCGPVIGSPGEILSSEAMAFVLREAREWADVVLLDAPPILAAADASILGAYADGVIMVVSAGRTNRAKAGEAKEQLAAAGARVLGAVLIGGDDERDRDGIDDLDGYLPGGGFPAYGSFDAAGSGSGGWYGDDVITMTARTEPAPRRTQPAPKKKVSAAGRDERPRRLAEPSVPASARTTRVAASAPAGTKPASRASKPAPRATKPATRASKPATRASKPAPRPQTARAKTPAKKAAPSSRARTTTARAKAPAKAPAKASSKKPAPSGRTRSGKTTVPATRTRTTASRATVKPKAKAKAKARTAASARSRQTTRR